MKPDSLFTSQRAFQAAKNLYLIWDWLHSDQTAATNALDTTVVL